MRANLAALFKKCIAEHARAVMLDGSGQKPDRATPARRHGMLPHGDGGLQLHKLMDR